MGQKYTIIVDSVNSKRREKLSPHLSATHALALDGTHLKKFALKRKLCVSGLIDDLPNIDEYFSSFFSFFFSSVVKIYNVPF